MPPNATGTQGQAFLADPPPPRYKVDGVPRTVPKSWCPVGSAQVADDTLVAGDNTQPAAIAETASRVWFLRSAASSGDRPMAVSPNRPSIARQDSM
jgi:hypothetical protein